MDVFDKNKNYIDNSELIDIAESIKNIIANPQPFSHIHELPELSNQFNSINQDILEKEAEPIKLYIADDLNEVLVKLTTNELKENFENKITNRFNELRDKLAKSKELSAIRGIRDESDILMNKYINEINF